MWRCGSRALLLLTVLAPWIYAEYIPGRYIVELSTEPVAEQIARTPAARSRPEVASNARAAIAAEQQNVTAGIAAQNATVLDSVNTVVNALIVDAPDAAAAAQIALLPGVKRVVPARRVHMLLDHAIAIHKVPEAWNQVGRDQAGVGIKIAIIDSGIDANHPGFQDPSLQVPSSFPRTGISSDLANTNNKIIVARSYVNLLPSRDPDQSARDRVGHGTALAMTAAGVQNSGPLATITGVAPKAWLGNHKVFGSPGYNDSSSEDAILKALDDAVADGMDVINLSLGSDVAPRLDDDLEVQAIERATRAGVIVVAAAGNNGPDLNTMSSPATAPSAISVGATSNDRTFAPTVEVSGLAPMMARLSDAPAPGAPVNAALADVTAVDPSGLACDALPADSLTNRIVLILRGTCTFETKLDNAQRAGAIAALVYAAEAAPEPISMGVGSASLPAEMISYSDGLSIKQNLSGQTSVTATMNFALQPFAITGSLPASFSASGPNVDLAIKPDLSAIGTDMYLATQTVDQNGDMYDPSGYIVVDGTSFSAPLVAGAAALLRAARPGLSVDQYRSLLVNSSAPLHLSSGAAAPVQKSGAGSLDVAAALRSTVAAYPVSLSFGVGNGNLQTSRTLTLANVGSGDETFSIVINGTKGASLPFATTNTVQVGGGRSVDIPVSWTAANLDPGSYEGTISVLAGSSGTQISIPYWYAVAPGIPARITVLDSLESARRNSQQSDAILFRVTDAAGVAVTGTRPEISVVAGGGVAGPVISRDDESPGAFGATVRLGRTPGTNTFRIQAGDVKLDVSITGR